MSVKDLVLVALFAALIAVLGVFPAITIPLISVPITAQTFGVMLAGSVLGARRGGLAVGVFLVLVAIGLPLLAGGRGGLGIFAGPTAGFLVGWLPAAILIGALTEKFWDRYGFLSGFGINVLGGIAVIYVLGIAWLVAGAGVPLDKALYGSMAFIPGDIIKAAAAAFVSVALKRYRQHPVALARAG